MNPEQDDRQIDIPPLRETAAADAVKRAGVINRLNSIALGLIVATMLAGGGFLYGLDIGRRTPLQAEPPLVRADPSPIKEAPEDAGGLEVPFRDRLVFDGVRDPVEEPGAAALADSAEEPLAAAPATGEEDAGAPPPGQPGVVVVEPDRPAAVPQLPPPPPLPETALAAPEPTALEPVAPNEQAGPIVIQGADIAAAETDEPISSLVEPEPAIAPAAAPEPAAPAAPVQLAAAPTPIRIQVGAYRSEAAAQNGWNLLAVAHNELLEGLTPTVVEIDLGPGRGVFHRLQAGPLADRPAAAALCEALRAREQGCLVVGP